MNSIELDNISRDKIRKNIDCNYFVEAGAGSGKTSILVDRMLAMVESGIDIRKICAITFTKAAAGEFFERFQKALSESDSPNAQKALKNIALCFMGTIDAFCNLVLSEHPVEAKIPSSSTVIDDDEMNANYIKIFSEIAAGKHGKDLQQQCWRFKKYVGFSENVFINGLKLLMSTRNAQLQYKQLDNVKFESLYAKQIEIFRKIIGYLQTHEEIALLKDNGSRTAWKAIKEECSIIFENWDENLYIINSTLKKLKGLRIVKEFDIKNLGLDWNSVFEAYPDSEKLKYWRIKQDDDPLMLQAIEDFQFKIAIDFLHKTTDIVSDELRSEGKLSYFDYLLYLRDMLKEDAAKDGKLIEHIYNRHSYFLIDEFQDTNPIQSEIFFYLCAQSPQENWTQCIPKPGSLFVVGDPKQSIYRFRNADVAAFNRVKNLFKDDVGEVLTLTQNFRSTKPMCEYFNTTFGRLLPHETENQSKYLEIPLSEKLEDNSTIQGAYKLTYPNSERIEAPKQIAKIIANFVQDEQYTIFDHYNSKCYRPKFSDFMIITPTKPRLLEYMQAFVKAGLPFVVEGQTLFNDCPSLESITRIVQAIAFPNNEGASFSAEKLSGINFDKKLIYKYITGTQNIPTSSILCKIIDDLQIIAKCGTHNLEYMYYAIELLKNKEACGEISSPQEASAFLDDLVFGDSKNIERCIQLSKNNDRIKLANLHKVKGLEAPIVFLAGPSKRAKTADYRLDYSEQIPKSYVFSLAYSGKDWASTASINSLDYVEEKEKEEELLQSEEIRLLYVAATRARNALILANPLSTAGDPMSSNPWVPLLNSIDKEISIPEKLPSFNIKERSAFELFENAKQNFALKNRNCETASYEVYRPSDLKAPAFFSDEESVTDHEVVLNTNYEATLIGTIVHRLMELITSSGFTIDSDDAIVEVLNDYNLQDEAFIKILNNVIPQITELIETLKNSDKVYCELPFCYKKDKKTISHGVIDLIYHDASGWHIVDYKTNANATDLEEKYASQLEEYKNAFYQITGNTADVKIFHIKLQA